MEPAEHCASQRRRLRRTLAQAELCDHAGRRAEAEAQFRQALVVSSASATQPLVPCTVTVWQASVPSGSGSGGPGRGLGPLGPAAEGLVLPVRLPAWESRCSVLRGVGPGWAGLGAAAGSGPRPGATAAARRSSCAPPITARMPCQCHGTAVPAAVQSRCHRDGSDCHRTCSSQAQGYRGGRGEELYMLNLNFEREVRESLKRQWQSSNQNILQSLPLSHIILRCSNAKQAHSAAGGSSSLCSSSCPLLHLCDLHRLRPGHSRPLQPSHLPCRLLRSVLSSAQHSLLGCCVR
jgi:hypothetical protein